MDGLIEALRQAGVASDAALEAQVTAELSLVDHEPEQVWKSEGIIAAIAADRDAVLRVLLRQHLETLTERESHLNSAFEDDAKMLRLQFWKGTDYASSEFLLMVDEVLRALDLLAPEVPRV